MGFDCSTGGRAATCLPRKRATFFDLLDTVHRKLEDLQSAIADLGTGKSQELRIGSVPSIANVMVPRAIARVRQRYPDVALDVNILKIEEAIDYLLLGRGELVAISSRFDHPLIEFEALASGTLLCIVPEDSPLAARDSITPEEMSKHPLIGSIRKIPMGRSWRQCSRGQALITR